MKGAFLRSESRQKVSESRSPEAPWSLPWWLVSCMAGKVTGTWMVRGLESKSWFMKLGKLALRTDGNVNNNLYIFFMKKKIYHSNGYILLRAYSDEGAKEVNYANKS